MSGHMRGAGGFRNGGRDGVEARLFEAFAAFRVVLPSIRLTVFWGSRLFAFLAHVASILPCDSDGSLHGERFGVQVTRGQFNAAGGRQAPNRAEHSCWKAGTDGPECT